MAQRVFVFVNILLRLLEGTARNDFLKLLLLFISLLARHGKVDFCCHHFSCVSADLFFVFSAYCLHLGLALSVLATLKAFILDVDGVLMLWCPKAYTISFEPAH